MVAYFRWKTDIYDFFVEHRGYNSSGACMEIVKKFDGR